MKSKKNIVLVGMMGSGKSIIGKNLSKKIKKEFIDIDNKIEENQNSVISEIFRNKGEIFFRKIEEHISLKYLKFENKVISLGGGGFINPVIRKYCNKNCITIWLNWKDDTLIDRIKNSKKRPLAMNLSNLELQKLINKRSTMYNLSHYKISCDKLNKNQIVKKIIIFYENS